MELGSLRVVAMDLAFAAVEIIVVINSILTPS